VATTVQELVIRSVSDTVDRELGSEPTSAVAPASLPGADARAQRIHGDFNGDGIEDVIIVVAGGSFEYTGLPGARSHVGRYHCSHSASATSLRRSRSA
jgi:hypothetical protein